MINDILCDGIETVVPLDNLDLLREFVLQFRLLRVVKILVLANLGEFLAKIVVLNENLRDALLVEQRHSCAVIHGLLEIVFRNIIAEPWFVLRSLPKQWVPVKR